MSKNGSKVIYDLSNGMKSEKGFALIETLAALAILGAVAIAFLSGLATTSKAVLIDDEQAIAESLVRSETEYVKNCEYQYYPSEYSLDPSLTIPNSWNMPPPVIGLVHATDDGLQEVTVAAEHNGKEIFSVKIYKVDR